LLLTFDPAIFPTVILGVVSGKAITFLFFSLGREFCLEVLGLAARGGVFSPSFFFRSSLLAFYTSSIVGSNVFIFDSVCLTSFSKT
jgi:hypothetical protein